MLNEFSKEPQKANLKGNPKGKSKRNRQGIPTGKGNPKGQRQPVPEHPRTGRRPEKILSPSQIEQETF